jgi:hypothetical protein
MVSSGDDITQLLQAWLTWVEPAQRELLHHRSEQDGHGPILLRVSLSVPDTSLVSSQRL